MGRITTGISQIGGKFRLLRTILELIPYHEFYLEPFFGSGIILINKPRCRYECGNDLNSELINYLLVSSGYDLGVQEFTTNPNGFEYNQEVVNMYEEMKQGVFGLVSQEICNRIVRGELVPRNNIERAYFFYYLNKLTFGGSVSKGYGYMVDNHNLSREGYGRVDSKVVENAKQEYAYKTKGNMGLVNPRAIPQHTIHDKDFKDIKSQYSGILNNFTLGTLKEKQSSFRGITTMEVPRKKEVEEIKASYTGLLNSAIKAPMNKESMPNFGLINTSRCSQSGKGRVDAKEVDKAKKNYKNAQIKGINPKTTRPYTNNDCGLLSPLNPKSIKRLRYVNLTCYPFDKVYKMFYEAFHVRKGLGEECFVYFDPPYPGTEKYYGTGFGIKEHYRLIDLLLDTPFHVLLSIGGDCEFYLDAFEWDNRSLHAKNNWRVIPVRVKYSTDANSQKSSKEYLISNYNIEELPKMIFSSDMKTLEEWL